MRRLKPPSKRPAAGARSRGARTKAGNGASGRDGFGELIDLIADAKERGVFEPKHRLRAVARPSATNTPAAPFARIAAVEAGKTWDEMEGAGR